MTTPSGSIDSSVSGAVGSRPALVSLNLMSADAARTELSACCASERWIKDIIAGRPYDTVVSLITASDAALLRLGWADVLEALAAHPRIGAATTGSDRESAWSRQEQSGAASADDRDRQRLVRGNAEYETRFGYGFLICATGRSSADLLAALELRLGNDTAAEQIVVQGELAAIVRLRLHKAFG